MPAPTAALVDTRKTTPGWRALEKYAVRLGGARNHRAGLYDGVLIKNNHLTAAGSITQAVQQARQEAHHLLKIEVEVTDLAGLEEALAAGADVILLDNMDEATMAQAVTTHRRPGLAGGLRLHVRRPPAQGRRHRRQPHLHGRPDPQRPGGGYPFEIDKDVEVKVISNQSSVIGKSNVRGVQHTRLFD